jgi:hypothetical protein
MIIDDQVKSHFLNLYAVALTDTQIDTKELQLLFEMGNERGIPKEEIQNIILRPDSFKFTIPIGTIQKMEYLYDFARMAWANGEVDDYERVALRKFCIKFGFLEENIDELVQFLLDEAEKGTSNSQLINIVQQNL